MTETDLEDLAQATGLAIAMVGSLLEGARVVPRGEFSRHLANLAAVTEETDRAQGGILDQWAALAAQVSAARPN